VAKSMESHPDNISAALYGGLTFAWINEDGLARHIRLELHPAIRPVIAVPAAGLPTAEARLALPLEVAFGDAVFNAARSALLLHALTTEPAHLMDATSDRLHQDRRRSMYEPSLDLVEELRAAGIPAAISGAGPSVLAFASPATADLVAGLAGTGWQVAQVGVAGLGVRAVPVVL
jgi:homoserine kinase